VSGDIYEQLERHNTCVRNDEGLCLLQQSLYEIHLLRLLGDAMAESVDLRQFARAADAWLEARRG
jgi:hypothetical protein